MSLIDDAIVYAAQCHGAVEQRRKYTGVPYILHPLEVMQIVASVPGHTEEMLAAAVLHDVVEDTDVSIADVYKRFGREVHDLVWALTDQCNIGNRAARKAAEAERLSWISPQAQTIKYADLIANTASIVEHDKDFARIYLREKQQLLTVMNQGDAKLWRRAMFICIDALENLE